MSVLTAGGAVTKVKSPNMEVMLISNDFKSVHCDH